MPSGMGSSTLAGVMPASETPALAKAKSGRTPYVTQGCRLSSAQASGPGSSTRSVLSGTASAVTTPASVACTPDFSTHTQMTSPRTA